MWKFIVRRVLTMIPQIFILSIIVFLLAQAMPGDALTGLVDPTLDPAAIERQRELLGLNYPWYIQYLNWITGIIFYGDFGQSFRFSLPVTEIIGQRVYNTLLLSFVTLVFTYLIAVPLGVISGRYHDTWKDRLIMVYTYIGFAAPLFIFSMLMLWMFGFNLGWFPTSGSVAPGMVSGDSGYLLSRIHHVLLPAFSTAIISTVAIIQYLRNEIIDVEQKEYIITARAKGASEQRVYNKHVFRNSMLPIAASLGLQIAGLLGGTIFIETIFGFPGMGELFIGSITNRDFSVMSALIMLFGITTMVGTMLSDIFLVLVDPRIRIK